LAPLIWVAKTAVGQIKKCVTGNVSIMNPEHVVPQILLRSWPFPRGAGRIIDRYFSQLAFSTEIAAVQTTDGFTMKVFPNELIGKHLYLSGEFDRSTVEILCRFSEPGDILLDIGANIGYVSGCFLKNVPNSSVFAVEPQPKVVDLLRDNLRPFGTNRYQIVNAAISDHDGSGWLEICDFNWGASKLVETPANRSVKIELYSAERLFSSFNIDKVDLIKIDAEGHEETILRSIAPKISQLRPRVIIFEDHQRRAAPQNSIGTLLGSIGYHVFGLRKQLLKLDLVGITRPEDCEFNDYVAMRL
jgi:FkbM family methyltransferase